VTAAVETPRRRARRKSKLDIISLLFCHCRLALTVCDSTLVWSFLSYAPFV
jgi:hypothetical protein